MPIIHPSLEGREFSYSDVIITPDELIDVEINEVDLTSKLTKEISLKFPSVIAPMDTSSRSDVIIAWALHGGTGGHHYNYPKIENQIEDALRVKSYISQFVREPECLKEDATVKDVLAIKGKHGFSSVLITENGKPNSRILGYITPRSIRFEDDPNRPLKDLMKKIDREKKDKQYAHRRDTFDRGQQGYEYAKRIIKENNIDLLPIVDDNFYPVSLVTDRDVLIERRYPLRTMDKNGRLVTFIAVEGRLEKAKERIGKANDAGIDGIFIDQSVMFREQIEIAKWVKKNFPEIQVVGGNIDSGRMMEQAIKEGFKYFDALKLCTGPGYSCTSSEIVGYGREAASTVLECSRKRDQLKKEFGEMPLCADGGFKSFSKKATAIALGADTCMSGYLPAGTEEAPGDEFYEAELDSYRKDYRGMGSPEVIHERGERYGQDKTPIKTPEGKRTTVPYKGSAYRRLPEAYNTMQLLFQKSNSRNVEEFKGKVRINPFKGKS